MDSVELVGDVRAPRWLLVWSLFFLKCLILDVLIQCFDNGMTPRSHISRLVLCESFQRFPSAQPNRTKMLSNEETTHNRAKPVPFLPPFPPNAPLFAANGATLIKLNYRF